MSKHGKICNNDSEKVEAHVAKSKKMGKVERIENGSNFEKSLNYDVSSIVLTSICWRSEFVVSFVGVLVFPHASGLSNVHELTVASLS